MNKETVEEAAEQYAQGNTLEFAYLQEIPAFKAGAEWQKEQSATDAIEMLKWINEQGWYSSEPMWCNGEASSDTDGGKSTYTEITSQQLYELWQKSKSNADN
jgi:hypothetical protein